MEYEWLPHYSVEGNNIRFLERLHTGFTLTSHWLDLVRTMKGRCITVDDPLEAEDKALLIRLTSEGILVPRPNRNDEAASARHTPPQRVMVVQPHCDDYALSSGGVLAEQAARLTEIDCVTVFADYSTEGFPFREQARLSDEQYTRLRLLEDDCVSEYLGAKSHRLPYKDALARNSLGTVIVRQGVFRKDLALLDAISTDILAMLRRLNPDVLVLPAAIGWHYDHRLTLMACLAAWKSAGGHSRLYLYEDFPYCNRSRYEYWERIAELHQEYGLQACYSDIAAQLEAKAAMNNYYKSQFTSWSFRNIAKTFKELAYSTTIEGRMLGHPLPDGAVYTERFWTILPEGGEVDENA